jgi:hypothetical protein
VKGDREKRTEEGVPNGEHRMRATIAAAKEIRKPHAHAPQHIDRFAVPTPWQPPEGEYLQK